MNHAVELAPADAEQLVALGAVHRRLDDPEQATAAYKAALALNPKEPTAHFELATLQMLHYRDYRAAEQSFLQVSIPDIDGVRHAFLGQVRMLTGKWDLAVADFETVLDDTPMRVEGSIDIIIRSLRRFGPAKPFQAVYDRCLRISTSDEAREPANADDISGLAAILLKYAAYDEARICTAQALELDPDNKTAQLLAKVLADPDEPENAEALASVLVV